MSGLSSAIEELAAQELAGLPDGQLGEDVLALFAVAARLDGEIARRLVVFDRRGGAGARARPRPRPGCATGPDWHRDRPGLGW